MKNRSVVKVFHSCRQDVEIDPILGPEFFGVKQDAFYRLLDENEHVFAERYQVAASKGLRQRYIASIMMPLRRCMKS